MIKKILFVGACAFLIFATVETAKPKIYIIGDSTACKYTSALYPLTGWAMVLQEFLNTDSVEVADSARSGCSSKSFYTEGRWTPVKNALKKGDFVVIQFGHNDEKNDSKSTNAQTTFKKYLSIYIDDAISKGAIPILATPIERDIWNRDNVTIWESHITADSGDFPKAIRELATEKNIRLVDMTAITNQYFEKVGKDSTNKLFLILKKGQFSNYPDGKNDQTHLQERGAKTIAKLFVSEIVRQKLSPLDTWTKGSFVTNPATNVNSFLSSKKQAAKGKNTYVKDNTIFFNENQSVVSFTLYDLDGRVLNHQGLSLSKGNIPLNDRSGKTLTSGKYMLQFRLLDGSRKNLQITKQ
jgi:lysophospholipase L1-like esterase